MPLVVLLLDSRFFDSSVPSFQTQSIIIIIIIILHFITCYAVMHTHIYICEVSTHSLERGASGGASGTFEHQLPVECVDDSTLIPSVQVQNGRAWKPLF